MKYLKKLKKISKEFRPHIGLHEIEITKDSEWKGIEEGSTIFIYDHYALDEEVRDQLTSYCIHYDLKDKGINLEDIWLYWNFKKDKKGFGGMYIPFAFIKKDICRGPFNEFDGMLYLEENSAKDFENMTVHLYIREQRKSIIIANSFKELKILKKEPNREQSEMVKSKGNQLVGEGKPNEAIENFYESILLDTTNPNPYNNIGVVTLQQAKTILDSFRGEVFYRLSYLLGGSIGRQGHYRALAGRKNYDRAILVVKKAISLESKHEEKAIMYSELVTYYKATDRLKKARKACENGLQIDAGNQILLELKKEL